MDGWMDGLMIECSKVSESAWWPCRHYFMHVMIMPYNHNTPHWVQVTTTRARMLSKCMSTMERQHSRTLKPSLFIGCYSFRRRCATFNRAHVTACMCGVKACVKESAIATMSSVAAPITCISPRSKFLRT
jgi:hypothetical protein